MLATSRPLHYALLAVLLALVALPGLDRSALWDMDEGVNAECAREMMEVGTWIVPLYNYELRTAKPVMLYWLQRLSYGQFGVSEWSARLPGVVLSLFTLLLVYELGRSMFDPLTGLLAGAALGSCIEFVKLARAATPDAPFIFFVTLALAAFWFGHRHGSRAWWLPTAAACGLAILTKGPAGVALPGAIILVYFAWNRELRRLWDRRLLSGLAIFLLVAAPWYILVTTETRGAYIKAFIGNENINRALTAMENHRGPPFYYLLAMLAFFLPWSIVLGATIWHGVKSTRKGAVQSESSEAVRPYRFLITWIGVVLLVFSLAATKLPNYIAPLYPALAILTADVLRRWAAGTLHAPRWVTSLALGGLFLTGAAVAVGLLIAGGVVPVNLKGLRVFPGMGAWAGLGVLLIAAAGMLAWLIRANQRPAAVGTLAAAAVAFVALLAGFAVPQLDQYKSAKQLVEASGAHQPERDIRLASLNYTQESLTFYAERKVDRLYSPEAAAALLAMPRPAYVFLPEPVWRAAAQIMPENVRVAARCFDAFRNAEILVITNDGAVP